MRRSLLAALAVVTFAWTVGCGTGSGGPSIGGATPPAALNGQYAFLLSGFDPINPVSIAGSFKADGLGHITAGEIELNDNGTVSTSSSLAGTYTFDANGQSTLGTITFSSSVGTLVSPLTFGFALQASGASGDLTDLDANGFIVAGTMQQQNSSAFSLASLAASYIIKLQGTNSSAQTAAIGRFTLASDGSASNVAFDRSIAGKGTSGPSTDATLAASVTFTAPNTNGRGSMTVSISDGLASDSEHFAYYAVSANEIVAVQVDPTGTITADLSKQGAITANTVVTAGSVFGVSGLDKSLTTPNEISAVGQLVISTPTTGTMLWDFNDGGTPGTATVNPTVAFDPTTGRGTLAITNGYAGGLFDTGAFYLSASGTGFLLDTTGGLNSTTNRAMAGPLIAQTSAAFSVNADLTGLSILRAHGSSPQDAQAFIGLSGPPASSTGYLFLLDKRSPGAAPAIDQLTSVFSITGPDATTGRGTLAVTGTDTLTYYLIGPNRFLFIDTTGGPNSPPTLFFASPR